MRIEPLAIIFDYGNVLSAPQSADDVGAMARLLEVPVDDFVPVTWRYRDAYDKAELSPSRYWTVVARELSRTISKPQLEELIALDTRSWSYPHPVTPAWAQALRAAGLRTAILSNMPEPMRNYVLHRCAWLPAFDHCTFSCDVGAAKPMPEIYIHCLAGLEATASQTLFLDDREENVRAAQELGIHSILFTDAGEVACELEQRFSIPVRLPG